MKKREFIIVVLVTLGLAGAFSASAASAAEVNVYRLYNKVSKEHLYMQVSMNIILFPHYPLTGSEKV